MLATWEHSRGGTLTVADYQASGGIRNALTQTAEQAYESLTTASSGSPGSCSSASCTSPTTCRRAARRSRSATCPAGTQAGDADAVLAMFVGERMITVDADAAQITHDALLTAWPRLRAWIEENTEELRDQAAGSPRARGPGRRPAGRRPRCGAAASSRSRGTGRPTRTSGRHCPGRRSRSSTRRSRRAPPASARPGGGPRRLQRHRRRARRAGARRRRAVRLRLQQRPAGRHRRARGARERPGGELPRRRLRRRPAARRGPGGRRAAQPAAADSSSPARPQATASLLEASDAPSVAQNRGLGGHRAVGQPSARTAACSRRPAPTGRCGCGTWPRPGTRSARHAGCRPTARPPAVRGGVQPGREADRRRGRGPTWSTLWEISGTQRRSGSARPLPAGRAVTSTRSRSARIPQDARRGQRRRHGPAVARRRPGQATAGRRAAGHRAARGHPNSVAFSADGRMLAAGTQRRHGLAVAPAGTAARLPGPGRAARNAVDRAGRVVLRGGVQPGRETLAASSKDHKVWLWRCHGRQRRLPDGTLTGAANWANTVAFSPDGRSLAAGTSGANVLVWSLATRQVTAKLPHPQPVTSVTWDGPGPDRRLRRGRHGLAVGAAVSRCSPPATRPPSWPTARRRDARGRRRRQRAALGHAPAARCSPAAPCRAKAYANATAFRPAKAGGALLAVARLERNGRAAQREHARTGRASPHGDQRGRGRRVGGVQPGRQAAGHRRGRRVRAIVRRDRPRAPPAAHGGARGRRRRPHLHGGVRAGRHDGRRGKREHRLRPVVAAHQRRRPLAGGAGPRRHGQLPDRAGVHARQQDARDRQLRQERVPVERGKPGAPAAARRPADRPVRANVDGGVQPGRQDAGGRRQRRHRLAVEPGGSRAPGARPRPSAACPGTSSPSPSPPTARNWRPPATTTTRSACGTRARQPREQPFCGEPRAAGYPRRMGELRAGGALPCARR